MNIMYYVQDAHSFWDWIYFVCLIVIGSFLLINLCLVVIAAQFSETKQRESERIARERYDVATSSLDMMNQEPGTCWGELIKYLQYLFNCTYQWLKRLLSHVHRGRGDHLNEDSPVTAQSFIGGVGLIRSVLRRRFLTIQKPIHTIVKSKVFQRFVFSVIVLNSLSMAIEYHGQPLALTMALEYSNLIFTMVFATEMMLKIIADGYLDYIKNGYNVFDSIIVLISMIELHGREHSGLSVLRTFRLLRLLKLIRFMPTLRRQLVSQSHHSSLTSLCRRLFY